MPLYDYKCKKCNKKFEDFKMVSEMKTSICPECGGEAENVFTPCRFNFSIFHDYVDYHITDAPVHVKSREHKKQLLKENGLVQV